MTNYVFYDWTIGGLPEVLISTHNPVKADDMVYYLSKHFDIRISEVSPYVTQIDVKPLNVTPMMVLRDNITGVNSLEMGQKYKNPFALKPLTAGCPKRPIHPIIRPPSLYHHGVKGLKSLRPK